MPELTALEPDQVLDESWDEVTGELAQTVRDLTADQIARRDRKVTIKAFLASDSRSDDAPTAALRAFLELEGY